MKATAWNEYINKLRKIDKKAYDLVSEWVLSHSIKDFASEYEYNKAIVDYAYAISTKYGEASASLACEMYDKCAAIEGVTVPPALPANTATYNETAMAVYGAKLRGEGMIPGTVERLVKQVGADTTLQNAKRDGAYFAWIPSGDTCAFCITLASNGWQKASKKTVEGNHAEHIHANCNCEFAISFKGPGNVEGYDPDKYRDMYYGAEGNTPAERIRAIRRARYAENKNYINAQKRLAYRKRVIQTGGHHYITQEIQDDLREKQAAFAYEKYIRVDDSKKIAEATGLGQDDISRIRNHIFFKKHKLYDGYGRFAPDYDMAVAWKRLSEGKPLPRDITFLRHELLENELEIKYNLTASEAHQRATSVYDWWGQLMEETGMKGEKDGIL